MKEPGVYHQTLKLTIAMYVTCKFIVNTGMSGLDKNMKVKLAVKDAWIFNM